MYNSLFDAYSIYGKFDLPQKKIVQNMTWISALVKKIKDKVFPNILENSYFFTAIGRFYFL